MFRPLPRRPKPSSSTSTVSSNGWESSGWALSPLLLQKTLSTAVKHLNCFTTFPPVFLNPKVWNLLPFPSGKAVDAFISTLWPGFQTTSELVSISQRADVPTPLNVMAIGTDSITGNLFIVEVRIGTYANSGVCYGRTKSGDGGSVVVRPCPFSPTLKPLLDTLELTSRVRAALGCLATKECALFAMHCVYELRQFVGVGPMATESNGVAAVK